MFLPPWFVQNSFMRLLPFMTLLWIVKNQIVIKIYKFSMNWYEITLTNEMSLHSQLISTCLSRLIAYPKIGFSKCVHI